MKIRSFAWAALLSLSSVSAWAADARVGSLDIREPWARASVPGQTSGAGYLEVSNGGAAADRLVSVRSDAAERVEVHTMTMENGTARMRAVDGGLEIPAGGKVTLAPGGYHLMFMKIKAPFAAGASVPVVLTFEKAGEVKVTLPVKAMGVGGTGQMEHGNMHMPGMKN